MSERLTFVTDPAQAEDRIILQLASHTNPLVCYAGTKGNTAASKAALTDPNWTDARVAVKIVNEQTPDEHWVISWNYGEHRFTRPLKPREAAVAKDFTLGSVPKKSVKWTLDPGDPKVTYRERRRGGKPSPKPRGVGCRGNDAGPRARLLRRVERLAVEQASMELGLVDA